MCENFPEGNLTTDFILQKSLSLTPDTHPPFYPTIKKLVLDSSTFPFGPNLSPSSTSNPIVPVFTQGELYRHFEQLVNAIDILHRAGCVHRAIDLQHIFMSLKGNRLTISLFETVVRFEGQALNHCGDFFSMPPELLSDNSDISFFTDFLETSGSPSSKCPPRINFSYDQRSDLYSLGVIFFFLMSCFIEFEQTSISKPSFLWKHDSQENVMATNANSPPKKLSSASQQKKSKGSLKFEDLKEEEWLAINFSIKESNVKCCKIPPFFEYFNSKSKFYCAAELKKLKTKIFSLYEKEFEQIVNGLLQKDPKKRLSLDQVKNLMKQLKKKELIQSQVMLLKERQHFRELEEAMIIISQEMRELQKENEKLQPVNTRIEEPEEEEEIPNSPEN